MIAVVVLFCLLASAAGAVEAASIPAEVRAAVSRQDPIWVFLRDKGPPSYIAKLAAQTWVSQRALDRIALRGGDYDRQMDWPVYLNYKELLASAGMVIRGESRWLNAVAGTIDPGRLGDLADLDCVRLLRSVARHKFRVPEPSIAPPELEKPGRESRVSQFDYGRSTAQIEQIQVDWLHAIGLDGEGVLIGFLDTGYDLSSSVFDSLRVVATRDFINSDENVQEGDVSQRSHGTGTLSVCGGFLPGELIGTAPRAAYALAETEIRDQEIRIEEDQWISGLEWLDSLGCDLISSSLGYTDWYEYDSLDGNTALATVAADMAAARGLLVVNAAGNEGGIFSRWKAVVVPADGDSVLAVGAATLSGARASFSSTGPTADGRIKPDIMALGSGVWGYNLASGVFGSLNGTSFATPLVAGTCALLLQQSPSLTPHELIELLRETATQADDPDTLLGWGIVQAARAANLPEALLVAQDDLFTTRANTLLSVDAPGVLANDFSYFGDLTTANVLTEVSHGELEFFPDGAFNYAPDSNFHGQDVFTYTLAGGALVSAPATVSITVTAVSPGTHVELWPNPMTDSVRIVLPAADPEGLSRVWIYTVSGQLVHTREFSGSSTTWRGINDEGRRVASGIYLVLVKTPVREEAVKLALKRRE